MIKLFKNLTLKELTLTIFVVVLTCFQVFLDLTLPDYMSEITMLIQTQDSAMSDVYVAGGMMLLCAFGSLAISIVIAIIAARVASTFSFITRSKVFEKVMSFSMKDVNSFSNASLITRTTNDITQVQILIVMGMQMLIKAPITAVWAIIKISNSDSSFTAVIAIAMVVLISIVGTCMFFVTPRFKIIQTLTDNINKITKESLDGINVVRAYNAEEYQGNKFGKANSETTKTMMFISKTMSFLMPSIQMISNGLTLGIYLVGAVIINQAIGMEKMTLFSDMVVFSSYAMQVIMAFMMLCMVFMMLPRASVSAKRICEVLDTKENIKEGSKTAGLPNKKGEIEFKNVSFKYPDAEDYVLKNINFTAKKGEIIAFIGSTGCGKSTVVNLIPRFYDATEGEILVNGINVKDYTKNTLNSFIGYVSQKATLFKGSVESNIVFGDNNLINGDLDFSINTAQAGDFVNDLEEKQQAYISQGGANLSGGQKQRISIARAIYREPEIFIFDDSFSALDYKTDRKLRETLNTQCKDTTRLIVGQRIGTIKDADKIIVLEDGMVVGMGKHQNLLKDCDVYKQIALSQLSEEELNHG